VAEYVYPGPQTEAVNKAFARVGRPYRPLAQIGMIIVTGAIAVAIPAAPNGTTTMATAT